MGHASDGQERLPLAGCCAVAEGCSSGQALTGLQQVLPGSESIHACTMLRLHGNCLRRYNGLALEQVVWPALPRPSRHSRGDSKMLQTTGGILQHHRRAKLQSHDSWPSAAWLCRCGSSCCPSL